MSLCASVYMCFVVTCWERADLLALVCVVSNCEFVTFPLVSWVRCGTWLYRFLIFAPLLTLVWKHAHETRQTEESHHQVWPSWRSFHCNWTVSKSFASLLQSSAPWSCCGVVVKHSPCTQRSRAQSWAPPAYRMRPKAVAISQYGLSSWWNVKHKLTWH